MNNEKVKIKNKKTGAIKEVKKSLVGDFIGTGEFEIVEESKVKPEVSFTSFKGIKNK